MALPRASLIVCLLLALVGCGSEDDRLAALQQRIIDLEAQVSRLKVGIGAVQASIAGESVAYLSPDDTGHALVRIDLGSLAVGMRAIVAHGDGSRVTLQVGNLTSAEIGGLRVRVEWGPLAPDGRPDPAQTRSREIGLARSLSAASWSSTELLLDGVPPPSLGFVRVSNITHRNIRLRVR